MTFKNQKTKIQVFAKTKQKCIFYTKLLKIAEFILKDNNVIECSEKLAIFVKNLKNSQHFLNKI